jgi:hypothetical protein
LSAINKYGLAIESRINYVVNNLLLKQLDATWDKFNLLVQVTSLFENDKEKRSTRRFAKVMHVHCMMYNSINNPKPVVDTPKRKRDSDSSDEMEIPKPVDEEKYPLYMSSLY